MRVVDENNFNKDNPFFIFNNEEIWFPLNCFDIRKDTYEISNFSRIRRIIDHHILSINNYGNYSLISLNTDFSRKSYKVARLVAEMFCIKQSIYKNQVNHINLDKCDDSISNLEWTTNKENIQHAIDNGVHPASKLGEDNIRSIFTDELVNSICKLMEDNYSNNDIISLLELEKSESVYNLLRNIRKKNSWNSISDNYNIPISTQNIIFDYDMIISICELLQYEYNYNSIMDIIGVERSRSNRECIGNIKRRITYKEISKDYIW